MPEDIRNFADSVRLAASRNPDAPALIAGGVLTWAQVDPREDADGGDIALIATGAHPRTGQRVKVFVMCEPQAAPSEAELSAYCARNLARLKCSSTFEFVADLPHTVTGKVRKQQLENVGG